MAQPTSYPESAALQPANRADVTRQLTRVLESSAFHGSKRCQKFLQFAIDKALKGDVDSLKERTIAVEVFGRNADADLDHDSIVRVGAREVRKRLEHYYATEGTNDRIRIELPTGSYIPTFYTAGAVAVPEPTLPQPAVPKRRVRWLAGRRRLWLAAAAVPLLAAAVLAPRLLWRNRPALFDTFWQPVFSQQTPVLLVLAHPVVYHPSTHARALDAALNGPKAFEAQTAINVPPNSLNGSDFVPSFDQYVGFGDCVAAMRLEELFVRHSRTAKARLASKLDSSDLRDSAAVLIGAFTNRWSMELNKGSRYQFAFCDSRPCILDSTGSRHWTLAGKTDNGRSTEDYLIVDRLVHARTGGFLVMGAGLTQYGTDEAGRILSDSSALTPLLAKLPPGWNTRNVQLVLHSEILGDSPERPEVIAAHVW